MVVVCCMVGHMSPNPRFFPDPLFRLRGVQNPPETLKIFSPAISSPVLSGEDENFVSRKVCENAIFGLFKAPKFFSALCVRIFFALGDPPSKERSRPSPHTQYPAGLFSEKMFIFSATDSPERHYPHQ